MGEPKFLIAFEQLLIWSATPTILEIKKNVTMITFKLDLELTGVEGGH